MSTFQSTPSGGKATQRRKREPNQHIVSIHAFRGEGDTRSVSTPPDDPTFQSTPSGGKATAVDGYDVFVDSPFQSTPSGGKATCTMALSTITADVSIHAFRGEGDLHHFRQGNHGKAFQSTPSGGKATPTTRDRYNRTGSFNPRLPGGRRPFGLDTY